MSQFSTLFHRCGEFDPAKRVSASKLVRCRRHLMSMDISLKLDKRDSWTYLRPLHEEVIR